MEFNNTERTPHGGSLKVKINTKLNWYERIQNPRQRQGD